MTPLRVAVVGSGVAGLTAAHIIARTHEVTLFERDDRLGGHANTIAIGTADGREVALDTGFIVHNQRTYPTLLRLFADLGIATQASDMSFGVRCEGCGLEYAGARGMHGVVPRPGVLGRPRYLRMLTEVKRFHRQARTVLSDPAADGLTLDGFLRRGGYSPYFADHFMLPLTGAVWSSSPSTIRDFPARYLIRFLANHGMLTVKNSPQWRTVTGGSREYVARIARGLADRVHVGTPVESIARDDTGVTVNGEHRFDRVVIAAHPDQAVRMLAAPTAAERSVLGAFAYSSNQTVLHTDASLLPRAAGARASWNYLLDACSTSQPLVHVTYHLNRLQALREPVDYCVTLNQTTRIGAGHELRRMTYEHPVYTHASLAAQSRLPSLQGECHTYYCGAYHGWGFHEDGCVSGLRAALAMGCAW
ncbi:MAG TPA: FAD-dependent oxidoreductase [Gaiellales bacterium]